MTLAPARARVRTASLVYDVFEDVRTIQQRMTESIAALNGKAVAAFVKLTCIEHDGRTILVNFDEIVSVEELVG